MPIMQKNTKILLLILVLLIVTTFAFLKLTCSPNITGTNCGNKTIIPPPASEASL
jgi:hypothetical protein